MKRIASLFLVLTLAVAAQPLPLFSARLIAQTGTLVAGTGQGSISGTTAVQQVTVRVRNTVTGEVSGSVTPNATGGFSFTGLQPGTYVIEIVGPTGAVVGTSAAITLTAGAMIVAGIGIVAGAVGTLAGAAAVGAAAGIAAAAAAAPTIGAAIYLASTAGALLLAGGAIGLTAVVVAANDASPSQ